MLKWLRSKLNLAYSNSIFNLEREEMNWDLRRQQIQSDYEKSIKRFSESNRTS
ncbi:MAG: hypothetical protein CM15mP91_1600 [Chloroflexota bacterium]|nr:MAG: hypothetical protein CM15mP91_1600 [Chloroflexota bacterium]